MLGQQKRAVGVFSSYSEAEGALNELKNSGYPMNQVSVVARDAEKNDSIAGADLSDKVGNKADEGATSGAIAGGTVGGLTGLLVGIGALAIPGIGPVMTAGALGTALATALSGGAIGAAAGGLLGALVGLGIPEERAKAYNDRVSHGDYLVMVEGSQDEIDRAQTILSHRGIQDWGIYDAKDLDDKHSSTSTAASNTPVTGTGTSTATGTGTTSGGAPVEIIDRRGSVS